MNKIIPFEGSIIKPEQLEALNTLASKRVPKKAQKSHPGKGGQTFTYVDHVWVTEILQNALGNMWSWDVLHWEIFTDSVAVTGRLTLHIPMRSEGSYPDVGIRTESVSVFDRHITEVGVYDIRKGMTTASVVASAASRALCRCVMRMFGIGIEFYKKTDEEAQITPDVAWTSLKKFATNQGTKWDKEFEDKFIAQLKEHNITGKTIVDNYGEAYRILSELIGKVTPIEKMPEV